MWINVKESLPEEGTLVIASSGRAWGIAVFEEGGFRFEDWAMGVPTGEIIEWVVPMPSNSQDNIERNDSAELIGAFKHKGKLAVYLSDRKELEELPKTPTNNESHAIAFIQKELPIMIAQVGKVDRTSVQFIKGAINFAKKVLATAGIS